MESKYSIITQYNEENQHNTFLKAILEIIFITQRKLMLKLIFSVSLKILEKGLDEEIRLGKSWNYRFVFECVGCELYHFEQRPYE